MRVIPWITDPSVTFLINFIAEFQARNGDALPRVLEFGMGSSSLFFGARSSELVSFEHDPEWHAKTCSTMDVQGFKHEAHLLERPYSSKIEDVIVDRKFDIILIDGRDRVDCLREVLRLDILATDGILVLDNTERIFEDDRLYEPMLELLAKDFNLFHLEQYGIDRTGWKAPHRWITTVSWKRVGVQYRRDGTRVHPLRGLRDLVGRLQRSIRKRLNA